MQSLQPIEEGQMIPGRVIEVDERLRVRRRRLQVARARSPSTSSTRRPQIGENVYVILVRKEGTEGQVIVSKRKADEKMFWKNLRNAFDEHKPVEGTIDRTRSRAATRSTSATRSAPSCPAPRWT